MWRYARLSDSATGSYPGKMSRRASPNVLICIARAVTPDE